jgi:hypothetical protein
MVTRQRCRRGAEAVQKRCRSGAEAVQKRCASGAEAVPLVEIPGQNIVTRQRCRRGAEAVRKRCGSGAEAVRKRCGSGAEAVPSVEIPGRDFEHFFVKHWLWGAITYLAGRIAGEVAVFDSQGSVVFDRSALEALHGGS